MISMRVWASLALRKSTALNKISAPLWSDPSDSPSWFSVFLQPHLGSCKPRHEAKCLCTVRRCGDIKEGNLSGSHLRQLLPLSYAAARAARNAMGPNPSGPDLPIPHLKEHEQFRARRLRSTCIGSGYAMATPALAQTGAEKLGKLVLIWVAHLVPQEGTFLVPTLSASTYSISALR